MTLVTRCPGCGTTFRVLEEQIQAHGGKVRCGTCLSVFNARETLIALPESAQPPREPVPAEPAGFTLEPAPAAPSPAAARLPEAEPFENDDYGPTPQQLTFDDQLGTAAARGGAGWWAAGAVLLAVALAAQAAYFYRGELAARYPALKPHFAQFCELLGCAVMPPQRPRQIAIEASDLQATDAARPGVILLTATLRNHAGHDLGYPAIDLVLTNTREHTLARRIFLPAEYLGRGRSAAAGIPANAEITVRLELDTGDLNPAGFRLGLLPAPDER